MNAGAEPLLLLARLVELGFDVGMGRARTKTDLLPQ
jgi:hypothetical protein